MMYDFAIGNSRFQKCQCGMFLLHPGFKEEQESRASMRADKEVEKQGYRQSDALWSRRQGAGRARRKHRGTAGRASIDQTPRETRFFTQLTRWILACPSSEDEEAHTSPLVSVERRCMLASDRVPVPSYGLASPDNKQLPDTLFVKDITMWIR